MKYTLVFIFSPDCKQVLMIHKTKGPYSGCINGIGGKIEKTDIDVMHAAKREVFEETGIVNMDPLIILVKEVFPDGTELNVFCTKILPGEEAKQMETEKIEWFKTESLLDVNNNKLAGDGNIPYFINYSLKVFNYMKARGSK